MVENMRLRLASASPPPPDQTPERAALAEAIERHASCAAAAAKMEAALQDAENRVYSLVAAFEAAEETLKEAPKRAAAWLVAHATGDEPGPAVDLNALRAAVADRKEELDIQREARAMLSAALAKARTDLAWAESHVETARDAVLKAAPGIGKLVDELATLYALVLEKGRALHFLHMRRLLHEGTRSETGGWTEVSPARRMVSRFMSSPLSWQNLHDGEGEVTVQRWREAYEALKRDADAPLPE